MLEEVLKHYKTKFSFIAVPQGNEVMFLPKIQNYCVHEVVNCRYNYILYYLQFLCTTAVEIMYTKICIIQHVINK